MKIVGPFAAARQLDPATGTAAASPPAVTTWQALDRVTGMPALVYLLPYGTPLPKLPESPLLLPYTEKGSQDRQNYAACDLPPTAQICSDPKLLTQMGLRALMALHEAGVVHGGISPQQFWEDGGELLLAGAGLPWSEAPAPYRAPEGGRSVAADLYAFGVTLLRLGPLPAGLSDLLSPYPAQRPSARDALALMNAGPPLPPQRVPLLIDAPRARLPEEVVSEVEPLPLVADPDYRAPDIDLQDTVLVPDTLSRLDRQRREQLQPRRVADLPPVLLPERAPEQDEQTGLPTGENETAEGETAQAAPLAGGTSRVVRIKVKADAVQDAPPEIPLETPPVPLPPRLGLADAMPVRGRVLARTGERELRRDPLREVLKEVGPVTDVAVNEPRRSVPPAEQPVPAAPVPAAPVPAASIEGGISQKPAAPPITELPTTELLTTELLTTQPPVSAAPNQVPAQAPVAPEPSEWVEEWSAQGLVFSTLPPDAAPPVVNPKETPAAERAALEVTAPAPTAEAVAAEDAALPAFETHRVQEVALTPPAMQVASEPLVGHSEAETAAPRPAIPVGTLPSRREFKPVKMAWNPDGTWQVKHEDGTAPEAEADPARKAKAVAGQLLASLRESLDHWQRQRRSDSSSQTGNPEAGSPVPPPASAAAGTSSKFAAARLGALLSGSGRKESNRERLVARSVTRSPEVRHTTPDYFLPDTSPVVPGDNTEASATPSPEAVPVADLIVLSPETMPEEEVSEAASAEPATVAPSSTEPSPTVPPAPTVRAVRHSEAEPLLLPEVDDDLDIKPVVRADAPDLPNGKPPLPFLRFTRAFTAAQLRQKRDWLAALPRWWWLVLVALLLLGLLLWAVSRRNAQVGGHITPPSSCCSLQVQVYSPEGERLSVPVEIVAEQVPPESKLTLGSALGRAPGYVNADVPGHYRLGLQAESYQRAHVEVDLPRSAPLNITLQ